MRKAFGILLLVAVAWVLLIVLATAFIEGSLFIAMLFGLKHQLGMDTQTSQNYASSSGTLPMLVAALGFSTLLVGAWHHVNCHTHGCLRIGRHKMAGGKYVICTSCLKKGDGIPECITAEHIHEQHRNSA